MPTPILKKTGPKSKAKINGPKKAITKKKAPNKSSSKKQHYDDRDPYIDTRDLTADEKKEKNLKYLEAIDKARNPRTPTFYSILQGQSSTTLTNFHNKIVAKHPAFKDVKTHAASTKQGPHVVPFLGIHAALSSARKKMRIPTKSEEILKTLESHANALKPAKFKDLVGKIGSGTITMKKFAVYKYGKWHAKFSKLAKKGLAAAKKNEVLSEQDAIVLIHNFNKLEQIHPYATYGYSGQGAAKTSSDGGGETRLKPLRQQLDRGASKRPQEAEDFYASLLDLCEKLEPRLIAGSF